MHGHMHAHARTYSYSYIYTVKYLHDQLIISNALILYKSMVIASVLYCISHDQGI